MKIIKNIAAIIMMFAGITAFAQTQKETIKVSGNCGMCAKKIEAAAKDAGATKAKWDEETKILTVSYKASKTSNDAIQKKIAEVGYDTEKYTADEAVYKALHGCCQYDNKRPSGDVK
jgi:periplasmic mercuric ion binding protein